MNLQTAVSARLDPVLGVNPPGSIPSSSAAGSSDTFARLLERRVHESQGTSSSAPAAAPAPAETAQTAPAEASGTAKSPQSSQDDDPAPTPPAKAETAKEKASPSATSDKSDSKKEKSAEEPGTAAEVAAPADAAAAALAAAAMPAGCASWRRVAYCWGCLWFRSSSSCCWAKACRSTAKNISWPARGAAPIASASGHDAQAARSLLLGRHLRQFRRGGRAASPVGVLAFQAHHGTGRRAGPATL